MTLEITIDAGSAVAPYEQVRRQMGAGADPR